MFQKLSGFSPVNVKYFFKLSCLSSAFCLFIYLEDRRPPYIGLLKISFALINQSLITSIRFQEKTRDDARIDSIG